MNENMIDFTYLLFGGVHKIQAHCNRAFRDAKCPISYSQYAALRMIYLNPSNNSTETATLLYQDRSTFTRNCVVLSREGYIEGSVPSNNKRITRYALTSKGARLLQDFEFAFTAVNEHLSKYCDKLNTVQNSFKTILQRLNDFGIDLEVEIS